MPIELNTEQAINHIVRHHKGTSLYKIAKSLSNDKVKLQPIQIEHYRNGGRMRKDVAQRFLEVYDIVITDIFLPGVFE
jgi:hypothetical protein